MASSENYVVEQTDCDLADLMESTKSPEKSFQDPANDSLDKSNDPIESTIETIEDVIIQDRNIGLSLLRKRSKKVSKETSIFDPSKSYGYPEI